MKIDRDAIEETKRMIEKNENFFIDGIIVPELYEKAKYRILWILKDAVGDYCVNEYNEELINTNIERKTFNWTLRYVAYVSHGILNGIESYGAIPSLYEGSAKSLKEIAIINAKKTMGGTSSSNAVILAHYERNKSLIFKQIETYRPDIIIFGYPCGLERIVNETFGHTEHKAYYRNNEGDCSYTIEGNAKKKKRLYLWVYHPAARKNKQKYCEEIFKVVSQKYVTGCGK